MTDPQNVQREYYARTAADYDERHGGEESEHDRALRLIEPFIAGRGWGSVLDVGTGTGRTLRYLLDKQPGLAVAGIDPVAELIDVAAGHGVPREVLKVGSGDALPWHDDSFDVACALGVLHHVPDPARVIAEMTRVARHAVFISDGNRFGRGNPIARLMKVGLHRARLWDWSYRVLHGGNLYNVSEGDGVAYSYSVYDNADELASWSTEFFMVPVAPVRAHRHPRLTASHMLVIAIRD